MKKLYIIAISLFSTLSFAQQTISFETSEGFAAGNINGQQGWISTATGGTPPNITSQIVSSELATQGSNSLKIAVDPEFGPQQNPVMGGFYTFPTALTYNNFTLSFDVRLSEQTANSSDFVFRTVSTTGTSSIVTYINFSYNGKIMLVNAGSANLIDTTKTWTANTWVRVKIVSTSTGIQYYLNNVLIYTGQAYAQSNINRMDFVHDNYSGNGYIDNIKVNNETSTLSTQESVANAENISIYPNPTTDYINIKSSAKIKNVEVYEISGKKINVKLDGNKVDVKDLGTGTYLLNVETEGRNYTKQFIKK